MDPLEQLPVAQVSFNRHTLASFAKAIAPWPDRPKGRSQILDRLPRRPRTSIRSLTFSRPYLVGHFDLGDVNAALALCDAQAYRQTTWPFDAGEYDIAHDLLSQSQSERLSRQIPTDT